MSATDPSGKKVEMPRGRRARGRQVSDATKTRLRDLVLVLLIDGAGLSIPDALDVLAKCNLSRSSLYDRLAHCPRRIEDIVREILGESFNAA